MKKWTQSIAAWSVFGLFVWGGSAMAAPCAVQISGNDQLKFDKSEIRVPKECQKFEVTLVHTGKLPLKAMGHNWMLAKESEWKAIATEEAKRFPSSPQDVSKDKRVIAQTTFVGGAEGDPKQTKTTVDVASLDRKQKYHFFCSFPGHFAVMNGAFILE